MKLFSMFRRKRRVRNDGMANLKSQLANIKAAMPDDVIEAHTHSSNHRDEILSSKICGCFYCLKTFQPSEIEEWVDKDDSCALCPRCGIDSVLGDASGFPINSDFLGKMYKYWFGDSVEL